MNRTKHLICMTECLNSKYSDKNNSRHFNITYRGRNLSRANIDSALVALEDFVMNRLVVGGNITTEQPLAISQRLRAFGFKLVAKFKNSFGLFLLDTEAYVTYKNKSEFEIYSMEDDNGKSIQIAVKPSLPKLDYDRIPRSTRNPIDCVFNNKDKTVFVEFSKSEPSIATERSIIGFFKTNKEIFNYLGIKRVVVSRNYDADKNNWSRCNHSVLGKYMDVSKSYYVLYINNDNFVKVRNTIKVCQ